MRYLSLLMLAAATLTACHPGDKTTTATSATTATPVHLTAGTLYDADSVLLAFKAEGSSKAADQQFGKGVDLYRNQHNPQGSIALFKASIFAKPQARAYYELGNALLDSKQPKNALKAYAIAELLNYKPLSKLLFNTGCAWAHIEGNEDSATYYVVSAIEFGYANATNVFNDPDLKTVANTWTFRTDVQRAIARTSDPDRLQWNLFTHEVPVVALPLTLDLNYQKNKTFNNISFDFERFISEMRNDRFARETGQEYLAIGTVRNTDSVRTLIYATQDEYYDDADEAPVAIPFTYYIASYNQSGKLIDKMQVAGREKITDPYKAATIAPNGDIEVSLWTLTYEKNVEDSGYENNKLVDKKEVGKEHYTIAQDGHIVKQGTPLAMR